MIFSQIFFLCTSSALDINIFNGAAQQLPWGLRYRTRWLHTITQYHKHLYKSDSALQLQINITLGKLIMWCIYLFLWGWVRAEQCLFNSYLFYIFRLFYWITLFYPPLCRWNCYTLCRDWEDGPIGYCHWNVFSFAVERSSGLVCASEIMSFVFWMGCVSWELQFVKKKTKMNTLIEFSLDICYLRPNEPNRLFFTYHACRKEMANPKGYITQIIKKNIFFPINLPHLLM